MKMSFSPETYALCIGRGGGGGGSFPTPTAADVGSALTVQKVPVQGATIVPEQTITLDEDFTALLTSVEDYQTMFISGAEVFAVVDGESYYSRVVGNLFLEFGDGRFQMCVEDGHLLFFDDFGEASTVACYAAGYAYEYVLDPYVGWDVVLSGTYSDPVLVKGDYATLAEKIASNKPVSGLKISPSSSSLAVHVLYSIEQESNDIYMVFFNSEGTTSWIIYPDNTIRTDD